MRQWHWTLSEMQAALGITQSTLAVESGISRFTLQKLVGDRDGHIETLVTLYRYFAARLTMPLSPGFPDLERPVTLHDLIAVDGVPAPTALPFMTPAPKSKAVLPGVYWNTENLRRDLGLTQQEMAERLGLRQPNLSRIEHGRTQASVSLAVKVLDLILPTIPSASLHHVLIISLSRD